MIQGIRRSTIGFIHIFINVFAVRIRHRDQRHLIAAVLHKGRF